MLSPPMLLILRQYLANHLPVLMVMSVSAVSRASTLLNPIRPCFAATYADLKAEPTLRRVIQSGASFHNLITPTISRTQPNASVPGCGSSQC